MRNKILYFIVLVLSTSSLYSQSTIVEIANSANACNLVTDCNNNLVCFDVSITLDQTKSIEAYSLWLEYDNMVLSRTNGGKDASCIVADAGDTDLESFISAYRIGGLAPPAYTIAANTSVVMHTVCFNIIDFAAYEGTIISVGGAKAEGKLVSSIGYTNGTVEESVPEYFLTLNNTSAPCLNTSSSAIPEISVPQIDSLCNDSAIVICPKVTDEDNTLAELSLSVCAQPSNGTLIGPDASGCFTYTPDLCFAGLESFCIEVCDVSDACSSVQVGPFVVSPSSSDIEIAQNLVHFN